MLLAVGLFLRLSGHPVQSGSLEEGSGGRAEGRPAEFYLEVVGNSNQNIENPHRNSGTLRFVVGFN